MDKGWYEVQPMNSINVMYLRVHSSEYVNINH